MDIKQYLKKTKSFIDKELDRLVPVSNLKPKLVYSALRYALKGGKRIRPILCIACAEVAGAKPKDAIKAACAIEMVHAYSLVHDDLPCMDNDDYRRGKATVHKRFGIANAVLAGDALLTEAFTVLSCATKCDAINIKLVKTLSTAAGISGMIAGQAVDIEKGPKDLAKQEYINIHKTGALIAASCKMGAILACAREKDVKALHKFGEYIGMVFQLTDDIIDNDGLWAIAGRKNTFARAKALAETAKENIRHLGKKSNQLFQVADFILNRKV